MQIQIKKRKTEWKNFTLRDIIKKSKIHMIGIPERRERTKQKKHLK